MLCIKYHFTSHLATKMNSDNKIEDLDSPIGGLDSNQIAESLQSNKEYINHLMLIVRMMLHDKESKLDGKSSIPKVNSMLKKLLNILSQARSLYSHENYLSRIAGLKLEFTKFLGYNGTVKYHCLCAIKILEALVSHVTTRKKETMSSFKDTVNDNFQHFIAPTQTIVYPVHDGSSEQVLTVHSHVAMCMWH